MQMSMISKLSSLLPKKQQQQRKSDRKRRTLPVRVDGVNAKATTRDLSFSGVYFETTAKFNVGSIIKITIDLSDTPGARHTQLQCEATIIRVDNRGSKVGVAAQIDTNTTAVTTT
jgi:hypothetical protein